MQNVVHMERRSSSQTLAHWPTRSLGDVAIRCDILRSYFSGFMFWPVSSPRPAASAFAGKLVIYLLKTSLTALRSGCRNM